jgi:hypothetical protein
MEARTKMPISRGEDWGESGPLPADGVVVHSDAEARRVVEAARREGAEPPPLGLAGGDLCRTLGGRGDPDRLRSADAVRLPVDLGSALVDGRIHWFIAHLVARRSRWRGRVFVAMNAAWYGAWRLGPRAHPNDGRLDITDGSPGLADRLKARRRLPSGDHLPHPMLETRQVAAIQVRFQPGLRIWLDHEPVGEVTHLSVRVEPDALLVVV